MGNYGPDIGHIAVMDDVLPKTHTNWPTEKWKNTMSRRKPATQIAIFQNQKKAMSLVMKGYVTNGQPYRWRCTVYVTTGSGKYMSRG